MVREPYVAQILPNLKEARLITAALRYYVEHREETTPEEADLSWGLQAHIYQQMKRRGEGL